MCYSFNKNTHVQTSGKMGIHRQLALPCSLMNAWLSQLGLLYAICIDSHSKLFPDTRLWACRIRGAGTTTLFIKGTLSTTPNVSAQRTWERNLEQPLSQKHSGAHTSCYLSWLPPVEKHLDLDLWKCMKQGLKHSKAVQFKFTHTIPQPARVCLPNNDRI